MVWAGWSSGVAGVACGRTTGFDLKLFPLDGLGYVLRTPVSLSYLEVTPRCLKPCFSGSPETHSESVTLALEAHG